VKDTNRSERSAVIIGIVTSIRDSSTKGGGFVHMEAVTKRWYEVGDKVAWYKVGQSLHDTMRMEILLDGKANTNCAEETMDLKRQEIRYHLVPEAPQNPPTTQPQLLFPSPFISRNTRPTQLLVLQMGLLEDKEVGHELQGFLDFPQTSPIDKKKEKLSPGKRNPWQQWQQCVHLAQVTPNSLDALLLGNEDYVVRCGIKNISWRTRGLATKLKTTISLSRGIHCNNAYILRKLPQTLQVRHYWEMKTLL
jgi:hypothetical protein